MDEQEGVNNSSDVVTIPDELLEGFEDVLSSQEPENDTQDSNNSDDASNSSQDDVDTVDTDTTQGEQANEKKKKKKSLERGLNKERKQRKEAEKKARELESRIKALEDASKKAEKSTYDTLIESGVEENIAKSIASAIDNKKDNSKELEKEIAELKFEKSLSAKSKEEGFEDIEEYADEIKELVDKGLSIEQAYYASSYDKPKTINTKREIESKIEAKMQNNNARKEILGNTNSNVGASTNSTKKINLSKMEYAVAKMAGMTPEEYAAVKGMDSVKDYTNYAARKKK